jgi:hypothetical protein
MFKIMDILTGEFSSGGAYPHWSKRGKTWTSLANLRKHLSMFPSDGTDHTYDNSVINVYELTEVDGIHLENNRERL